MRILSSVVAGLLSVICTGIGAAETATLLWYAEQEPGVDPYQVRYIVSRDFMRSDEGDNAGGFILLDRREKQIYNVMPHNRTILRIDGRGEPPQVPADLAIDIKRSVDDKAPRIAGKMPVTLELVANQQACYSAVVLPGHLEQAREALQEFAQALSIQQSRTLALTPQEYQTPCFLSRYLYATDFHLQQGIPLVDWNQQGHRRELIDYQTGVELDQTLFELPDGFTTIEASER